MVALLTLFTALAGSPNLVVVSLDTTRADALSCYGEPRPTYDARRGAPRTPNLDRVAAEGVRFEQFFAQSPTTLASHTTLFTGLDPHEHRVVRNGFPVPSDVVTLAQRLHSAGYETRAVLGSAALERGTGIERGFESYDDRAPELKGIMYQSTADAVVDRALGTVDGRQREDAPLFLFVHFFDVHSPYDPPEPFRSRFLDPAYEGPWAGPRSKPRPIARRLEAGDPTALEHAKAINGRYYAEAAYVDAQIGRLLEGLEARGVLEDALLVVVGDHGETLDERAHFGWAHGSTVGDGVTRVPLLMRAYGEVPLARHAVVQRQAAMENVAGTLEQALGLPVTLGDGMWDLVRPGPVHDQDGWPERPTLTVFQEATKPRRREARDAWNNLPFEHTVRAGGHVLRSFPIRNQPPHIVEGDPGMLETLRGVLDAWNADAPGHTTATMADHQLKALKALGYVDDDDE